MEKNMKTIMGALAAAMLLGVAALPAAAEPDVAGIVRKYVRTPDAEPGKYVDVYKRVPRQPEYIADKMEVGSGEWWRQMDRERRGGRR
jgi:hypothetical protein